MVRSLKQLSTHCGKCGVVFDETLSNKRKGRALCLECYHSEFLERSKAKSKWDREHKIHPSKQELYHNYTIKNRKEHWRAVNKEIKLLTDMVEIREFISNQMDRILSDETLMDYINDTQIIQNNKKTIDDRSKK
jgi:uncharacterized Zn finger protein (UPF0148 family)